jgi:hypothetical protein
MHSAVLRITAQFIANYGVHAYAEAILEESMYQPISAARVQKKFKSNEELAKRLVEHSPHLEWPKGRSVATSLGALDKGNAVWWVKRPAHAAALADLLEVPLVDLGLHGGNAAPFPFSTFPELPPLNLADETPPAIASVVDVNEDSRESDSEFWFDPPSALHWSRGPASPVSWLHFPPGTGLGLYWARSKVLSRHEHVHVGRLVDARQRLGNAAPVVIRLDRPCEDIDLLALAERHPGIAILVVAPFEAPMRFDASTHESLVSWDFSSSRGSSREIMRLTNPQDPEGICRLEWRLHVNWKEILTRWAATRMSAATGDTLLSAEGVQLWLDEFASSWDAPLLPADLLAICRICHHTPKARLPRFSDSNAGRSLLKSVLSLTAGQAASATSLMEASFRDRSVKWGTPLNSEKWASFLPSHAAVPDQAALLAIAQASSLSLRRELAAALSSSLRDASLSAMIDCGIFAGDGHGNLQLQPRFLADLVARDCLINTIRTEPAESWAMYCYDPDRRRLVGAALAAISLDDLVPVVTKLAAQPATAAAAIAASDALFCSVGMRITSGAGVPHPLRCLPGIVLARLSPENDMTPFLWSREYSDIEDVLEWYAICWAWSLGMEAPDEANDAWAWHFPGWASDVAAFWFAPWAIGQPDEDAPVSQGWIRLLAISRRFVAGLHALPACPPEFLKPLLVAEGLKGRWAVDSAWLHSVLVHHWASDALLREIEQLGQPAARALLPLLFEVLIDMEDQETKRLLLRWSPIHAWVLRNISYADASACLSDRQWEAFWSTPQSLPPHLLRGALQSASEKRVDYAASCVAIDACGESETALLEGLLADEILGRVAAARLWEVAPQAAERSMCSEQAHVEAVRNLVNNVPRDKIGAATQAINRFPDCFDDADRVGWARARLADSGVHAESVLSLLTMPGRLA